VRYYDVLHYNTVKTNAIHQAPLGVAYITCNTHGAHHVDFRPYVITKAISIKLWVRRHGLQDVKHWWTWCKQYFTSVRVPQQRHTSIANKMYENSQKLAMEVVLQGSEPVYGSTYSKLRIGYETAVHQVTRSVSTWKLSASGWYHKPLGVVRCTRSCYLPKLSSRPNYYSSLLTINL
jgi:hypothetical protein